MIATLYGIKNCDSVKKARTWLDTNGVNYRYHDWRLDGVNAALIKKLSQALGWEALLNKRSTSWRQLPEECKRSLSYKQVERLLLETPTLIKRPVLVIDGQYRLGFTPDAYQKLLFK